MITLSANIMVSEDEIITVNQENMKSIKCNFTDRESIDEPSWGIVSNRGELSFYDPDRKVLGLIESKRLNTKVKIEVFINNTLAKVHKSLGEFYSGKWKYDNDSRLVSVSLKDDLEEWQEVVISQPYATQTFPRDYDGRPFDPQYFSYLYLYYELLAATPPKFKIVVSQEILTYLSNIKESGDSRLSGNTLWARWQQFCEATMLHIYKNDKGEVVISNHK